MQASNHCGFGRYIMILQHSAGAVVTIKHVDMAELPSDMLVAHIYLCKSVIMVRCSRDSVTQHRHVQHAALSTLAFAGHYCRLPCHDGSCDAEACVGFYGMVLTSAVKGALHHIKQGEARGGYAQPSRYLCTSPSGRSKSCRKSPHFLCTRLSQVLCSDRCCCCCCCCSS